MFELSKWHYGIWKSPLYIIPIMFACKDISETEISSELPNCLPKPDNHKDHYTVAMIFHRIFFIVLANHA